MNDLNPIQKAIIMSFITPVIDEIVDRVVERLQTTTAKKVPKYYTRKEIAEILHITLPTLARLTKDGHIACKRVGTRVLYEANAIDEAVTKQFEFKIISSEKTRT